MVKKYRVSCTFLSSLLFDPRFSKVPTGRQMLALAPSYHGIQGLEDLTGNHDELAAAQQLFPGMYLENDQASKENFIQYAPDYDIIHLGMHSLIDNSNPEYSKLIFSQKPFSKKDNILMAYEIPTLRLKAWLAVLSSCGSGFGINIGGEGYVSLGYKFLYSGVPSVVMTLWSVKDISAFLIMKRFYHHLYQGRSVDESLQTSKTEFIFSSGPRLAHPYYWSGYQCIGKTNLALPGKDGFSPWYFLLLLPVFLVALVLWKRKKDARVME